MLIDYVISKASGQQEALKILGSEKLNIFSCVRGWCPTPCFAKGHLILFSFLSPTLPCFCLMLSFPISCLQWKQ